MKKMLFAVALLFAVNVKAEDLITTTLLGNVMPVTQFKSGETKLAVMDSVVLIGKHNGKSILDLQAGFSGEAAPEPGEANGSFVVGGFFKLSSFTSSVIQFPSQWEFLRAIEFGPAYVYDFRDQSDYLSFQVGLSFQLMPKI